jgi:3-oxoacyl-[acyl-carrier-protein] synthase II
MGEAFRIIARGRADLMVSGGADSKIHPLSLVRMSLLGQMSRWKGKPSGGCRPFDVHRDGWVPGEGAGILILEEREHALKRGARIYGEILGFGSGCDGVPGGGIDDQGIGTEIALRAALKDAGLDAAEVGHVNAHGAGTVAADAAEAKALERVFGKKMPITAMKGYFGNLVSGTGAVELIGSLLGVNHGLIPPIVNCDEPAFDLDFVCGASRPTANPIFATTNLTRHGQTAAMVIRGNPSGAADVDVATDREEIAELAAKG